MTVDQPAADRLVVPRSYLYVPADRDDMLVKSTTLGADAVIADLEDAVLAAHKPTARDNVVAWLRQDETGIQKWVRVNAPPYLEEDLAAVVGLPSLAGIVVAKSDDADLLGQLPTHLPLQPLIESARALAALSAIASTAGVERLQLGEADLSADLGTSFDHADYVLGPVRLQIVVTSAAAGIEPPVGPVSTNFRDLEAFERSTVALAQLGFGSRAVIHPAQVEVVNRVFTPSPADVDAANNVLQLAVESSTGIFLDPDGRMVDEAVLRSARRVLGRARELKTSDD